MTFFKMSNNLIPNLQVVFLIFLNEIMYICVKFFKNSSCIFQEENEGDINWDSDRNLDFYNAIYSKREFFQ